jgi:hypothetical protein
MVSLAVHVAHADNVFRGIPAAPDGVEAASSSVEMPSLATAFSPAPWAASVSAFPRATCEVQLARCSSPPPRVALS